MRIRTGFHPVPVSRRSEANPAPDADFDSLFGSKGRDLRTTSGAKPLQFSPPHSRPLPWEERPDELMGLFDSLDAKPGRGRLAFITDSGHSDQGFQWAMSLAKSRGLLLDLILITPPDDVPACLIPEIVTLDAAGIPFQVTHRHGELKKEIKRYAWVGQDALAYIIDVSDKYWGFLRYTRRQDVGEQRSGQPLVLLIENGSLV
jgi:hypothetical protein